VTKLCHKGILENCASLFYFPLGIPSPKASDFDRNLDLKIRGEQQTTSGQQTVGGRRLLLTSDFQIEISFKFEVFFF